MAVCTNSSWDLYWEDTFIFCIVKITPCVRVCEKLVAHQLLENFPAFFGACVIRSVVHRTRHWFISWNGWIQSASSLISRECLLISSQQWLSLFQMAHYIRFFRQNILFVFFFTCVLQAHPLPLVLIAVTIHSGLHGTEIVMCTLQQKPSIFPDWKWRKHNAAAIITVIHNFHAWLFSVFHSWQQFVSDVC